MDTIYQPPVSDLPAWVKTEGDVCAWLNTQGAEPGSRWTSEGPLPGGGRMWKRLTDDAAGAAAEIAAAKSVTR